eukprot:744570_1
MTSNIHSVLSSEIATISNCKHMDVKQFDHIIKSLDVKFDQYLQHEMNFMDFIQQDEQKMESQLTQMIDKIGCLRQRHKELMRSKQRQEAILTGYFDDEYPKRCESIR